MLDKLRQLADDSDKVLVLIPDHCSSKNAPVWQIYDLTFGDWWDDENLIAEAFTVEECLILAERKLKL